MKITNEMEDLLTNADGKALATYSSESGVNVVPVSTVRVIDGQIVLVNYFFNQTLENLRSNPEVSFAFWRGLSGYKLKARAHLMESGAIFEEIDELVKRIHPGRVVKGVVVLEPVEWFDISAGSEAGRRLD
jgi:uncharacterized protein